MKAVVAAFNQEKALVGAFSVITNLVGAFSVITNLRMEIFEALPSTRVSSGCSQGKIDKVAISHIWSLIWEFP